MEREPLSPVTARATFSFKNVLGRGPDQAGLSFWLDQLSHGTTRAVVLVGFTKKLKSPAFSANC
jgi:hypothetical protein